MTRQWVLTTENILRLLKAVAFNDTDGIWWRMDESGEDLLFFAHCGDLFDWGTADLEPITNENLDRFIAAVEDCQKAVGQHSWHGPYLFAARERKMRPQGAFLREDMEPALVELFLECGPERETGLGNPYKPKEYTRR